MTSRTDRTRVVSPRALLALVVLAALCVSDGVGPRLLPLPGAAADAAAHRREVKDSHLTPAPSGEGSGVARVAMAAPARRQAGAGHYSPLINTHAAEGLCAPSCDAIKFSLSTYSPVPTSPAAVMRPPGRAPPLSA